VSDGLDALITEKGLEIAPGVRVRLRSLADYRQNPENPVSHTPRNLGSVVESIYKVGAARSGLASDDTIYAGNLTSEAMALAGIEGIIEITTDGTQWVMVNRPDLTPEQRKQAAHGDQWSAMLAEMNVDQLLADIEAGVNLDGIYSEFDLEAILGEVLVETETGEAPEAQTDRAAELQEVWRVERGQVWQCGRHRLMCGDSTSSDDVGRLVGDDKAVLCHADPPYGMGKEKEGIVNDNLYREKLDAFQMAWWSTWRPFFEDNASAYIWGNAEDLWRLWFVGGLRDSERLTFRNQIVWNKPPTGRHGFAPEALMKSPLLRQFYVTTEYCFFFMLGEQGFSINAENYWEGWEPIRAYLDGERQKMGWDKTEIHRITGMADTGPGMFSHWFTKSQFAFITEEHYKTLQAAAKDDAFKREYDDLKREYDDLKREFYATRAYFDNTHDNMTDVWQFPRVSGDERHDHPSPKPVAMVERAIKSSTPVDAIVAVPFCGAGAAITASENIRRLARAMDIEPKWCAVTLQRLADMNLEPKLLP
jgi:DNA modification methylase